MRDFEYIYRHLRDFTGDPYLQHVKIDLYGSRP
jgi:hypothetical protein